MRDRSIVPTAIADIFGSSTLERQILRNRNEEEIMLFRNRIDTIL